MTPWIEAMRLRTLPVSIASVTAGCCAVKVYGHVAWLPALLCFVFAILAQIASNFANEYFDFKAGLDKPGREGPRRGVTEGDITPRQMLIATCATLALACAVGCSLIYWGGWWLIAAGAAIALGVFAYSAGPYPLSRHGLGEVGVILFFGVVPVNLIFYIMTGTARGDVVIASVGAGLMAANILIVNNYRDREDDSAVGKTTLAVKLPPKAMIWLYYLNGLLGVACFLLLGGNFDKWIWLIPAGIYWLVNNAIATTMGRLKGRQLNPLLGMTALNFLMFTILFYIVA
ncbi:MAG: 1,4-dihydroxy-2-naphthoate octaprenyltransferase [Muribaculaceae bacterium]|nr:1,4-dihydroxy-2-naphthoate octaprenyltransferase [Muribaculaceae bacterium]